MKLTVVYAVLAATALSVGAVPAAETNADRLAHGLSPLPPRRRATPAFGAKRSSTSSTPSQCNTGPVQCCDSVQSSNSRLIKTLLNLLGVAAPAANTPVGVTCSPLSVIGGHSRCSEQPVCCENNSFNGIIAIGCTPININL